VPRESTIKLLLEVYPCVASEFGWAKSARVMRSSVCWANRVHASMIMPMRDMSSSFPRTYDSWKRRRMVVPGLSEGTRYTVSVPGLSASMRIFTWSNPSRGRRRPIIRMPFVLHRLPFPPQEDLPQAPGGFPHDSSQGEITRAEPCRGRGSIWPGRGCWPSIGRASADLSWVGGHERNGLSGQSHTPQMGIDLRFPLSFCQNVGEEHT